MSKLYRSIEELDGVNRGPRPEARGLDDVDRRDFLKLAGFSLAAVTVTACQRPIVEKAIPYLTAPEEIVPGRSYSIASTCHGCPARCGILVKCRDGRPIKIEGNPGHPLSRGGICAVGQAMVLGLYDSLRVGGPVLNGKSTDWTSVDSFVAGKLAGAKRVRVMSSTLPSPTAKRVIDEFLARFEDGSHIIYDVPSCSAIADAHEETHGVRAIPHYRFDKAEVIVSLDADFLGTWISPVEFTKQRSAHRGYHVQLEPRMSLTGSNADQRLRIDPRDTGLILAHLAAAESDLPPLPFQPVILERIAQRLRSARGKSLVVCGSQSLDDQRLVNFINGQLGNYGTTIDVAAPSYQRQGSDAPIDLSNADAVFILGCNPVYDLPNGGEIAKQLARAPLVVTFASHADETSKHAHAICPDHHPLESWDDSAPVAGLYAVTQPAIAPLRNTRSAIESFAAWSGKPAKAYDLIKSQFTGDWDKTLNDGYVEMEPRLQPVTTPVKAEAPLPRAADRGPRSDFALVLYPSISQLDGRHAHNAWLHELPDPITKLTWDNVASIAPETAKRLDITDGDVVRVNDVELPAFVQPGQHPNVIAIAIGYGRMGTDRFAKIGPKWLLARTYLTPGETVGKRVVQLPKNVTITKAGRKADLASTQLHNTMEGRPLVGPDDARGRASLHSLWPTKVKGEHQWALTIDLDKCTGCSACVVACQVENNVPVVGKDEVVREREMHWIRIDRYYEGEGDDVMAVHEPVMCAHCGNAPCESVCPVLATVHSSDGLNQQVYNRCVGTRYCANNCPYKARRFNWFDYPHDDRFANLVLNPDVAVRSRGVMEKCSMCTQRIEEARIEAKQRGMAIPDGAIRMACEQSCPADAIVFGDLNDPKSRINTVRRNPRHFRLLEELNVEPAVGYLKLTRNA
ncbi:MAG TPA: 4Fe-4S dicluster domain-containing protein [Thermoanaerobaculia bacterium]|nr:4Fe-4S dicluster domain-containing protein [Thermoanaerobaculia bacterium]